MPEMGRSFHASVSEIQTTLSIFMIGLAASQLITGPLSDRFGRRPVILSGMALYALASVVCIFAPNIQVLIVARFLQALGACAGPVLGRAIVRDLYEPERSIHVLAVLGTAMAIAPALAPIIGSWLLEFYGWRSSFVSMSIFGAIILIATFWTLEETNRYRGVSSITPRGILANFKILLQNQAFRGYGSIMALSFGGLFVFISGSSIIMIKILGLTPKEFGYAFSSMVVGFALGSSMVSRLNRSFRAKTIVGIGVTICFVATLIMAGLAWSDVETTWAILIPNGFFSLGIGLIMPTCLSSSIGPFPRLAGSAASLIGFFQGACAAGAGWTVSALYDGTSRGLATSMLVFAFLSFAVYVLQVRNLPDNKV